MHLSGKYGINEVCSRRPVFQFLFFKVAVLYGFDLSQVFTLIILRLYQPHSLCEKGATRAAAKAALYVFLLTPLREGRLIPEATMKRAAKLFRPYARGDSSAGARSLCRRSHFYSRPYARGDRLQPSFAGVRRTHFYSRPYARGDRHYWPFFSPVRGFLLAPLREGRQCAGAPFLTGGLFLLAPLREGRQQFFTKPQVDLYDKLLKIHIFQINTFCILQYSFENFKGYFVGSARTSRKNVYGKGWR